MGLRAEESVFWPNIWTDLEKIRQNCHTCHKLATTQANMPPVEPIAPDYPFQHFAVDYMHIGGYNYRVYVDMCTGWLGSAAADIVTFLTRLCHDYGCDI